MRSALALARSRKKKRERKTPVLWTGYSFLPAEPVFTCSILGCSRETLHEAIKIFIELAQHVARIQFRTQA